MNGIDITRQSVLEESVKRYHAQVDRNRESLIKEGKLDPEQPKKAKIRFQLLNQGSYFLIGNDYDPRVIKRLRRLLPSVDIVTREKLYGYQTTENPSAKKPPKSMKRARYFWSANTLRDILDNHEKEEIKDIIIQKLKEKNFESNRLKEAYDTIMSIKLSKKIKLNQYLFEILNPITGSYRETHRFVCRYIKNNYDYRDLIINCGTMKDFGSPI